MSEMLGHHVCPVADAVNVGGVQKKFVIQGLNLAGFEMAPFQPGYGATWPVPFVSTQIQTDVAEAIVQTLLPKNQDMEGAIPQCPGATRFDSCLIPDDWNLLDGVLINSQTLRANPSDPTKAQTPLDVYDTLVYEYFKLVFGKWNKSN